MAEQKWTMPTWMHPYAEYFTNTGCEPTIENIEELVNGNDDPAINLPMSTIQFGVKSQVAFLTRLYVNKELSQYG